MLLRYLGKILPQAKFTRQKVTQAKCYQGKTELGKM